MLKFGTSTNGSLFATSDRWFQSKWPPERKAPLFFLEASPLVTSADTEASTHKRENKPFGTLGSDRQTC